jgi:hypothetical protein
MKEKDWLVCTDPEKMLKQLAKLKRKLSARKQRLYCVACCRRLWPYLEEVSRRAVEIAERYADGQATLDDLEQAHDAGLRANRNRFGMRGLMAHAADPAPWALAKWAWEAVEGTSRPSAALPGKVILAVPYGASAVGEGVQAATGALAAILRDIAGNPFRDVGFDSSWRSANVTALAQSIYGERAFDRLPILADALEDVGCDRPDVLKHCRDAGEHARGCWIVDLILGKG